MTSRTRHTKVSNKEARSDANDSIAGSMLPNLESELGLDGLFSGKMVHTSFDCPENLREAFKQETCQDGSSACKELQKYMASRVVVSRLKRHALGNTLSKVVDAPFVIENLVIPTYVQGRVRRYCPKVELVQVIQKVSEPCCSFSGHERVPAAASFRHVSGRLRYACRKCADRLTNRADWKRVE